MSWLPSPEGHAAEAGAGAASESASAATAPARDLEPVIETLTTHAHTRTGPGARARISGVARDWLLPSRTLRRTPWAPLLGAGYVALIATLGGLRSDHLLLGSLAVLDLYNERTRAFLRTFVPFILTGAIFDSMRYFYWQGIDGRVHVAEPYVLDRDWFGVGGRTWNEFFLEHHWPALDLACGFAYLVFVAEYVGLAVVLFLRGNAAAARTFARCFLLVNVMGFATYFVYPAAPPWYVTEHGLGPAIMHVAPAAAAASRFDALLGTQLFADMYGKGVDVYGAYPSLHVSYPLLAVLLAFRLRALSWARAPATLFFALMCLSAVYLQHHYVTDVLLGAAYAAVALAVVTRLERRAA